jgi:hypothetical protein
MVTIPIDAKHLHAFGFESFRNYRLWCLRQGLVHGLPKGGHRLGLQQTDEQEIAPHHTEERRQHIEELGAGKFPWNPSVKPIDWLGGPGIKPINWLKGDQEKLAAFKRLLLHVDRYMDVITQNPPGMAS